MPKHYLLRAGILVTLSSIPGCVRYEYVAPDCGPSVPDPGHSRIAWQHAGPPGRVSGHIVALPAGTPLQGQVRIQGRGFQRTDTLGYVSLDSVPQGIDTLVVRVFAHSLVSAVIDPQPDSGIVFIAVMEPRLPGTDGCGFVLEQRRKPWWKVF